MHVFDHVVLLCVNILSTSVYVYQLFLS